MPIGRMCLRATNVPPGGTDFTAEPNVMQSKVSSSIAEPFKLKLFFTYQMVDEITKEINNFLYDVRNSITISFV